MMKKIILFVWVPYCASCAWYVISHGHYFQLDHVNWQHNMTVDTDNFVQRTACAQSKNKMLK